MLEPQMRLRPNDPVVLAQPVENDTIIINQSTDVYYRLDRVGSLIWTLLTDNHSIEQITKALAEGFGVLSEQAHGDVQRLAEQMLLEKIVVPADGIAPASTPAAIARQEQAYESPKLELYRMSVNASLHPNVPEVAATVIDGEAIIINVLTGVYYSLDAVGAVIWSLIDAGFRNQQIIRHVAELYGVEGDKVRQDLEDLACQLVAEGIVRVSAGPPEYTAPPPMDKPTQAYRSPELNIYRDMEDLLALDPPLPTAADTTQTARELHIGEVDWTKPQ